MEALRIAVCEDDAGEREKLPALCADYLLRGPRAAAEAGLRDCRNGGSHGAGGSPLHFFRSGSPHSGGSFCIKSVYAPLKVYANGQLIYEYGLSRLHERPRRVGAAFEAGGNTFPSSVCMCKALRMCGTR